jgi:hypothetical protein
MEQLRTIKCADCKEEIKVWFTVRGDGCCDACKGTKCYDCCRASRKDKE